MIRNHSDSNIYFLWDTTQILQDNVYDKKKEIKGDYYLKVSMLIIRTTFERI